MGKRKQLAIPADWSGEWQGVCVAWPKSPEWESVLRGLLSMPWRGRLWDADTGTITEVTAIGEEIFNRSFPFSECEAGEPEPPITPDEQTSEIVYIFSDDGEEDEDEMSCKPCLKFIGGKLYQMGCDGWELVPGDQGQTVETNPVDGDTTDPETPIPGDPLDVTENVSCKKAWSMAHAAVRVHQEIIDAYGDVIGWIDGGNRVASRLPEYTLNKAEITYAFMWMAAAVVGGLSPSLLVDDPDAYEGSLAAWIEPHLTDDYDLTQAEYLAVITRVNLFGLGTEYDLDIEGVSVGAYWGHIFTALGFGTCQELCLQARSLEPDTYSCGFPAAPVEDIQVDPDAEWILDWDFTKSDGGWWKDGFEPNQHWVPGLGWEHTTFYFDGGILNLHKDLSNDQSIGKTGQIMAVAVIINLPKGEEFLWDDTANLFQVCTNGPWRVPTTLATGTGRLVLTDSTPYDYEAGTPKNFRLTFAGRCRNLVIGSKWNVERIVMFGTGEPPVI